MLGNQMSKYSRTNNPLPLVCKLRASATRGVATEVQFLNQTCLSENKGVVGVACSTLPIRFLLICNVLPCCYLPHLGDYPPETIPNTPSVPELLQLSVSEYSYKYDSYGNWTEQIEVHRSGSNEHSTVRHRKLGNPSERL